MGYLIVIVLLLLVVPLLIMLLTRRAPGGSRKVGNDDHGVTPSEPSSDQPSPAGGAVNKPDAQAARRIPPG